MIATPHTGAKSLPDRRARRKRKPRHRPRPPLTLHLDLVPTSGCEGRLRYVATHLARIIGRGNLPIAVDARCEACERIVIVGFDGRVWPSVETPTQEEYAAGTVGRRIGLAGRREGGDARP